jgi:DNA-directed RNA polymerase specialized sigma24 family protein
LSHLHTSPISLEPLTRTNTSGEVYKRNSAVERQVLDALSFSDDDLLLRAGINDSTAAGYLQEEALVYLIRTSFQRRNQVLYNKLAEILLTRCQDQVTSWMRGIVYKEDAVHDVIQVLFEKIVSPDHEGDYLQVRFWHNLKRISLDVRRKYLRDQTKDRHYLQPSSFQPPEETGENEWENVSDTNGNEIAAKNGFSSVEMEALWREALHILQEPMRTAVLLHYITGWQIESKDPNEITVSKYFRKTPKTIHNWLRQAENELSNWRGDHHE